MDKIQNSWFFDVRIHFVTLILVIISELIGIIPVQLGPVSFSLLPMLYALVLGIGISRVGLVGLSDEQMTLASEYVGYAVMILIAFMASSIGPNLSLVLSAGPALLAQEFGNLGTVLFAMPIAVLVFRMDRTSIGSAFSTSRETSLAIIGNLYGLDGPEGRGVMGSYITGTLLGTIFCGILSSIMINIPWFLPESLAMASGTGSASMMSASIAPIVEAFPENAETLMSFAATSQVLTSATGIYVSIFIAIPMSEGLYSLFKGRKQARQEKEKLDIIREKQQAVVENKDTVESKWGVKIKTWVYSGLFGLLAIWLASLNAGEPINPIDAVPGMLWLLGIVLLGNIIDDLLKKIKINLPTILYIALLSSILSIPELWSPALHFNASMTYISLLPLCTPILAYAGIATAREMDSFKKQGLKIIFVTLFALAGTFVGSAIVSNIILKMTL